MALPPSGPFLIILSGYLFTKSRFKRFGHTLMISGFVTFYLFSISLVGDLLCIPLEKEHPPYQDSARDVDGIVVLTAGLQNLSHLGLGTKPGGASILRLNHGIEIYRKLKSVPIIICGGNGDPANPHLSEGRALWHVAISLGVPEKDLILEDKSKTTYEGIYKVKALMGKARKRIILVTSAMHMPRSVDFYRKGGFEVIPAPTDYITQKIKVNLTSLIPSLRGLKVSSTAISEYLLRVYYYSKS